MDIHYNAFISYRHHPEDIKVAEQIHKGLEHYRVPKTIRKKTDGKMRLFRDKEELPITSNLTDDITRALHESDFLIVICSTHTKESHWVQREIETFLQTHDHSRVLTVLVNGENPYEIIPEILCSAEQIDPVTGEVTRLPIEPLSCDWRVGKRKAYREELPRLAAALLGCGYDELRQRERQYRTRRLMSVFSVALVAALAFAGYVVYNSMQIQAANDRLEEANNQLTDANIRIQENLEEARRNQSQYLASASEQLLESGDRMLAMALALEALPEYEGERPYVAQAELSLSTAVGAYKATSEVAAVGSITGDALINYFEATDERDWMYVYDARSVLSVWDLENYQKHAALKVISGISKMLVTPQDNVLVHTLDKKLYSYDKDLNLLWQAEGGVDVFFSAQRDVLLVEDNNNTIRFLDVATGQEIRDAVQVYLRPEDQEENWEMYFHQESYDLTMPIVLEYYDYGQPRHVISLDLSSGEMCDLGELPEGMIVRQTGITRDGNLLVLTAGENGVWNSDFGLMMTNSQVDVQLLCYTPGGEKLWSTEMTSYSFSEIHTLHSIGDSGNVFCQIDNLFAVIDGATGAILGACESGARPVWVTADEDCAVILLEDGFMGTYFYEDNEFNSSRYIKDNIDDGFAGKGVFIKQKYSSEILIYRSAKDDNWQVFPGEYSPTVFHKATCGDLVATDYYNGIAMFDVRQRKHLWTLAEESGEYFQLLGFSEDGSVLWISIGNEKVAAVDSRTGAFEKYSLPEETEDGMTLYYSVLSQCIMADGILYFKAINVPTNELCLVTFDTGTQKTTCQAVCTTENWILAKAELLAAYDGTAYLWEEDSAAVYSVEPATGKVDVFLENVAAEPVIHFLDDKGRYIVCRENQVTLYGPGGSKLFEAELEDRKGVSGFLMEEELLLLTDAGNITRFSLSGEELGVISCHIYTSFLNSAGSSLPDEVEWTLTKDGDLFVNLFDAGNLIDCETWQRRAWIPDCVAYLPELEQFVTSGKDGENNEEMMGTYPLYSLEDIKAMATEALKDYQLTPEQKAWYGIS